ncbi:MAG: hypothetical protein HOQ36_09725, partial [Nocardia sp.]|nr:hypothetical protein [Nocardia sp.]
MSDDKSAESDTGEAVELVTEKPADDRADEEVRRPRARAAVARPLIAAL